MKQTNNTIVGALALGIALVGGAYLAKNFGTPTDRYAATPVDVTTVVTVAPERKAIEETDTNNDGVADWREQILSSAQIITPVADIYTAPDTLTAQIGLSFFENYVQSQGFGTFGATEDELVSDTVRRLDQYTKDEILDVSDITIGDDVSPQAIRTYANAMALAIKNNEIQGYDNEISTLQNLIRTNSPESIARLNAIADVYKNTLEQSKSIVVPKTLTKIHLDILNIYTALYNNAKSFTAINNDPLVPLLRLQRYEDDTRGAAMAFRNLYLALEPYSDVFVQNDPAIMFVAFRPQQS